VGARRAACGVVAVCAAWERRRAVSRGESAAAGNSGRGALEGPGAQWVHPILPQAPTGEGMGAPKHWKSLSASDPQRSHRAWQRQQSRWLNKHGLQQVLPLQTPQALSLSSSSTRAQRTCASRKSTYSPSIPADTTKCTGIVAFLWIGCPITTRPVATSPSFASGGSIFGAEVRPGRGRDVVPRVRNGY
jgi:hypothetical protein